MRDVKFASHSLYGRVNTAVKPPTSDVVPRRVVPITGDGNCLFRSIAYATGDDHVHVRRSVVHHLKRHWDRFGAFVADEERETYLDHMAHDGTWGDELALEAYHERTRVPIHVHDASTYRLCASYTTHADRAAKAVQLAYNGAHYDVFV